MLILTLITAVILGSVPYAVMMNLGSLDKSGKHVFRIVATNNTVSNEVIVEVSRKITVKATPSYLEVKPGATINFTVTLFPQPSKNAVSFSETEKTV